MNTGIAWRIAPCGTAEVYVLRTLEDATASVCGRVGRGWSRRPMTIARADLFATREEASAEYRRRRADALAVNPVASLDQMEDA